MRGRLARAVGGILLGALLTYVLLRSTGDAGEAVSRIVSRVARTSPRYLMIGFCLFVASQIMRSFRWKVLAFRRDVRMSASIPITAAHIGLSHILPVRLSEVALLGMFRYYGDLPVGDGMAMVILSKLTDLLAMGVVIGGAVAAGLSGTPVLAASILVVAGFAGILMLPWLLEVSYRPLASIFLRMRLGRGGVRWLRDLRCAASIKGQGKRMASAMALSVLAWGLKLWMFSFLLMAVGVRGVPLWKVFFASGFMDLTLVLPVHGLLSLGTAEAGWAAGFAIVGITGIVEEGFSVHLLWLSMAIFLMLLALPFLASIRGLKAPLTDGGEA
ncbi:hypothetical protein GF402_05300 [Candidatus Fermentibacteria bacterium]|nr:hypothetical protein [Candidatus Fermentibacteria bacterium]